MPTCDLSISAKDYEFVNTYLSAAANGLLDPLRRVIAKYGTPEAINAKARESGKVDAIIARLRRADSPYVKDLEWLATVRDKGAFVSISDYRASVLGDKAASTRFDEAHAVTLEISSLHYFPWLMAQARQAIDKKEIMAGRYVRFRKMKEQEADGELLAAAAAMRIIGASYVEALDTRGADGSNIHLAGPDALFGYLGGTGQPNDHPIAWIDEFLYYYTNYGSREVLNFNSGTFLAAFLLYRLGVDIQFKVSVLTGHDNALAVMWVLLMARLLARPDGTTPLIGLNLSNSVEVDTLRDIAKVRRDLGFESEVRIEHHVNEPWLGIVRQPYMRREDILAVAKEIPNISAKHEGGDPDDESVLARPGHLADYFRTKAEVEASGEMPILEEHWMLKHKAVNRTARALTEIGAAFIGAPLLHRR